jgi:hypothetical protein
MLPRSPCRSCPTWASPVWHLFVVRTARRDALQQHLAAHGVGTQVHYPIPPHLSRAYAGAGWKRGDFPLAEQLADEVLSLPIGPHVSRDQVDYVCEQIRGFFPQGGASPDWRSRLSRGGPPTDPPRDDRGPLRQKRDEREDTANLEIRPPQG